MSRQNKSARNKVPAVKITKMHQSGEKGPAKTTPQHGKRWTYRNNPDTQKRLAEMLKVASVTERTSGRAILRQAGGASKDED